MGVLATTDRAAGSLARLLGTAGQIGLVCLGVHLAADALDDRVLGLLSLLEQGLDRGLGAPCAQIAGAFDLPLARGSTDPLVTALDRDQRLFDRRKDVFESDGHEVS